MPAFHNALTELPDRTTRTFVGFVGPFAIRFVAGVTRGDDELNSFTEVIVA